MVRRSVIILAVLGAGLVGASLLAFLPYTTPEYPRAPITVRCGAPALSWRTEAVATGRAPVGGTAGASVERYPACGKGVAERLSWAVGLLGVTSLAAAALSAAPVRRKARR